MKNCNDMQFSKITKFSTLQSQTGNVVIINKNMDNGKIASLLL